MSIVEANSTIANTWKLDTPSVTKEVGTARTELVRYRADGDHTLGRETNFQIQNNDTSSYFDYARSYIQFKINLYRADGTTKITSADITSICAEFLTVWRRAELRFNDAKIQEVDQPGLVAYVLDLIQKSVEQKEAHKDVQWAYDVKAGDGLDMDNATAIGSADDSSLATNAALSTTGASSGQHRQIQSAGGIFSESNDYDPHYARRIRRMATNAAEVLVINVPLSRFFSCVEGMKVSYGSECKILLQRHVDQDCERFMYGDYNSKTVLKITACDLYVPKLTPSIEVEGKLMTFINAGGLQRHTFLHPSYYSKSNQTPATHHSWKVAVNHRAPKYVLFWLNRADRNTHMQLNPLVMDRVGVTSVSCRVNSHQFPSVAPYQIENSEDNSRLLIELQKLRRSYADDELSCLVDLESFLSHKALFVFDVSDLPDSAFKSRQMGEVTLDWTQSDYTNRLNFDQNCVILSEREVEIASINGEMKFSQAGL